ncbi:hypothetical protein BgAZ_110200 [Babesia gibsoni]|uniref:CPW-WPC domain-containing protein n=1 Tax=Babesia gibsoni TaxID=33632 RepID=A0AAD8PGT5_BABGI|nr:hypothetical protein BgAZ_110200 [Babesia gibsoni]
MIFKKVVLHLFFICCLCKTTSGSSGSSKEEEDDVHTSPAEDISQDLSDLNKEVSKATEEKSDEEDKNLPPEELQEKRQKKFEDIYQSALEEGLEEGKASFRAIEHATVEELDLLALTSEHLKRHWYTGQCRRDYSPKCPNGWNWAEDENACIAPQDYQGPCNNRKNFTDLKAHEREEYAWKCQVSWPCVGDLPIDESILCPLEWVKISNKLCLAPNDYDGICPPISDFNGMSLLEKTAYEQMCSVKWQRVATNGPVLGSFGSSKNTIGSDNGVSGAINDLGVMVPM